MKEVTRRAPGPTLSTRAARRPRRVGVAEAKAKLSQVLRSLDEGPIVIHSRGRDIGALVDIDDYERLLDGQADREPTGGAAFLATVEELKRRHHGGVDDFDPIRAEIVPDSPFQLRRRR